MALPSLYDRGIQTGGYTAVTPTSNYIAGASAVGAITSAFSAWNAGQMQKNAYAHEAAMAEINARQVGIDAMFRTNEMQDELTYALSLQNVMAAAGGRSGGSVSNIAQTSQANLQKERKRLEAAAEGRKVASLMDASSKRAAGKTAASQGLLGGSAELLKGTFETQKWIS